MPAEDVQGVKAARLQGLCESTNAVKCFWPVVNLETCGHILEGQGIRFHLPKPSGV